MLAVVIRHSGIVGAARLVAAVSGFAFLAYAGRVLGPDLLGRLLLIGALVGLFSRLINVGFSLVELREIAASAERRAQTLVLFLVLRFGAGVLSYSVLALFLSVAGYGPEINDLALIMGLTLLLEPISAVGNNLLTGTNRVGRANAITVGIALAGTGANMAALLVGLGVSGVVLSNLVIGASSALLWSLFLVPQLRYGSRHQPIRRADLDAVLRKLRPILPLMLFNASNHSVNTLLLSKIPGPLAATSAVGYFNPALSIARTPFNLLGGFRQALVAHLAERSTDSGTSDMDLASVVQVAFLSLALPIGIVFAAFAQPIVTLMLGEAFAPSAPALALLGAAMALGILVMPLEGVLLAAGRLEQLRLLPVTLAPLLLNVCLCVVLIPQWSHMGAAAALLGSRMLYSLLVAVKFYRHTGLRIMGAAAAGKMLLLGAATMLAALGLTIYVDSLVFRIIGLSLLLSLVAALPLFEARSRFATPRP